MWGDINEIWFNLEKKWGLDKPQSTLDNFKDFSTDYGVYNLVFVGHDYRWWNMIDGNQFVKKCLDHFCVIIDQSLWFQQPQFFI